jgi:CRISPR/Cas system-associated endoribonuclease Cas2
MTKLLLLLTFTLLCLLPAAAQDNMTRLLKERDELYKAYDHYNQQNSSLFGKKSKKDLLNIITTLKEIINKDTEIIREVRLQSSQVKMQSTQKESSFVNNNREFIERISTLKNEQEKLEAQLKLKTSEFQTQQEIVESQAESLSLLKIITGILAVTVLGLFWYIRRLKVLVPQK